MRLMSLRPIQILYLRRHYKIVLMQSSGLVRPQSHLHFAPCKIYIRVMPFALSQFTNFIGKIQGLSEILKLELFLKMMLFNHTPTCCKLLRVILQILTLHRLNTALTWDTLFSTE